MFNIRKINNDLYYIGCSDRRLALFESAYPIPGGVSYNSYLLLDDKTVLFDTVDKSCDIHFLENLEAALCGRDLDYLVVHHLEPDHAALIETVLTKYSNAKVVCTAKALAMIKQFFCIEIDSRAVIVKEGDTLNTGKHEFQFVMAPMVHWPEVMVTYDKTEKTLFSADAFGSFGAINGNIFDDEISDFNSYIDEARRYYTNIVGKYGMQVQMLLKKAAALEIKTILPLHGLIIKKNITQFIEKYIKWSTYEPEEKSVLIAYSSVYGGTENTVNILASKLSEAGCKNIKMFDVSVTHPSYVLSEAFKYSHIVLATTTYNTEIFESMQTFLQSLVSHNLQNRKFVLIQNGSWAPTCTAKIKEMLEKLKGTEIIDESLSIKSALKKEDIALVENLANAIAKSLEI